MNRIHAPEIEDFAWCPPFLRDTLTDVLRAASEITHVFDCAAGVVDEVLAATGAPRIVDLCSGAGGPALALLQALERRHGRRVDAVLTDKFPNLPAFARMEARLPGRIRARRAPVDATALPADLPGLRTMFHSLHHFRPEMARAIFAAAARARQPIATFEMVERGPQGALMVALSPLVTATTMLTLRPWSWTRLALTYALPVLPAVIAWDGFASCLRAYSPRELRQLVDGLDSDDYGFQVVVRRTPYQPFRVTSLVGMPRA